MMLCSEVAMTDAEKASEARCTAMLSQLIAAVKKQTLEMEDLAVSMDKLAVGLKAIVQPPGASAHALPPPVPAPTATLVTAVDHAVAAAAPRAEAALAPKSPTKCSMSGPDTNAGNLQVVAESDPETGVAPALAEHSSAPSPKLFSTIKQDTPTPTRCSTMCPDRSIDMPISDTSKVVLWPPPMKWDERQRWPPPSREEIKRSGEEIRPTPWPAFVYYQGDSQSKQPWPPQPFHVEQLKRGGGHIQFKLSIHIALPLLPPWPPPMEWLVQAGKANDAQHGGAASASEKLNALPIICQQEIQKKSVAWLIGWALILEYTIGGSLVARGISPDLALFCGGQDKLPFFIAQVHLKWLDTPVDPCAAILVLLVTALLCLGIKESSFVEGINTIANVAVMLFVICAGGWIGFQNGWAGYNVPKGYFPNGVSGVFSGSATLFFAYIGFDAVASTAEEVKNPQRDLPWGMGLTLSLCCILYMMISVIIVGLVPYYAMDPDTPISSAFAQYGMQWAVYVVSSGAVLALIASLIGAILPQPRIVMAMARDGLLPPLFSAVDQQTQVPTLSTILTGICAAILAFFMDVSQLAGMVSVGTLLAFTMVAISVLVVRYAPPNEMPMKVVLPGSPESLTSHSGHSSTAEENLEDPFGNVQEAPTGSEVANKVRRQKATRYIVLICVGIIIFVSAVSFSFLPFYLQSTACAIGGLLLLSATIVLSCIGQDKRSSRQTGGFMCPFVPILPICCILINVYLLMNLGSHTWIRVSIWLAAGALIYIVYGRKHSSLTGTAYQRISPA